MSGNDAEWMARARSLACMRLVAWGAASPRHVGLARLARSCALSLGVGLASVHRWAWVRGVRL
jgi:hypothetical protein